MRSDSGPMGKRNTDESRTVKSQDGHRTREGDVKSQMREKDANVDTEGVKSNTPVVTPGKVTKFFFTRSVFFDEGRKSRNKEKKKKKSLRAALRRKKGKPIARSGLTKES